MERGRGTRSRLAHPAIDLPVAHTNSHAHRCAKRRFKVNCVVSTYSASIGDNHATAVQVYSQADVFHQMVPLTRGKTRRVPKRAHRVGPSYCTRFPNLLENTLLAMFRLSEEIESRCPFCSYRQAPQFIEFMYRWGHGTWEQLEDYCSRLKQFRAATHGCDEWVKERLSKLVGIPDHHL